MRIDAGTLISSNRPHSINLLKIIGLGIVRALIRGAEDHYIFSEELIKTITAPVVENCGKLWR